MSENTSVTFAKALADETRQKIMELTCCRWLNVGDIAEAVAVSQPTVSHHLAVLREAGLVASRAEGKHTYYTLNQEQIVMCCDQLMRSFAPEAQLVQLAEDPA
jgi:DNA-binding transcriptional ArsR family regulator